MGGVEFVSDFFGTDIMNHPEFLKFVMRLGKDDEIFLAPMLEALASPAVVSIKPFYPNHQSFPKNPVKIMQVYQALKPLKQEHSFNIYEAAFLINDSVSIYLTAIFTCIVQGVIFGILVITNVPDYTAVSNDPIVWVITFATTLFFCKACYEEFSSAQQFRDAWITLGRADLSLRSMMFENKGMLFLNTFANQFLSIIIPIFNFYFMLLSENPNDAIMNGLALYFVVQLDQMAMPAVWDEERLAGELAVNAHDYIMEPLQKGELVVEKHGPGGYKDGDKLYVAPGGDGMEIQIFKRVSPAEFEHTTYKLSGTAAPEFMSCFHGSAACLERYSDIHD